MLSLSLANPYDYPLDFQALKGAARTVLEGEGVTAGKVTVAFVENAHIHRLNMQYLKHDEPTDVLTFPYNAPDKPGKIKPGQKVEGEVVIGYEIAQEYAADRGHAPGLELMLYVVHGCLHLCGYDDTTDAHAAFMRQRERHYLQILNLPDIAGD